MLESLAYILREIPKRSPRFLLRRAWDELLKNLRYLRTLVGGKPYESRTAANERKAVGTLLDLEAIDRYVDLLRQRRKRELDALLERAVRYGKRQFEVFGSSFRFGREIPWDEDMVSGYRWPTRFHTRYRYAELTDLEHDTDIKVPWELGRLQCLPVLALAYRVSGDDRHVIAAREIFESWSCANPVGFGIQWVIGMDVALRAVSLVLSAELLARTPAFERLVDRSFIRCLGEHGRFLHRNVEYSDVNGNHHTSCLVGLLYLGVWLEDHREARAWRARAVKGLRSEILLQTYPDGVCHEGSIPYHRLVTELFLHAHVVARGAGLDLGADYRRRLERMLEFVYSYTKPSGEAPVWGDADDGRVHKLGSQPINDHRYLTMAGTGWFRCRHWLDPDAALSLDSSLLLDTDALDFLLSALEEPVKEGTPSRGFELGGFFFLRAPGRYCMIDCGDIGLRGRGGHGHLDALSVEIGLGGRDVLTDTGCAAYTRSKARRQLSLSAKSHNAVVLDDREPAPLSTDRWPHANRYPVETVLWSPSEGVFVGRHRGYGRLSGFDFYQRKVEMRENGFIITDSLEGSGVHDVRWYFHLAEELETVEIEASEAKILDSNDNVAIVIRCSDPRAALSSMESSYFPTYSLERRRLCLAAAVVTVLPFTVRFEMVTS